MQWYIHQRSFPDPDKLCLTLPVTRGYYYLAIESHGFIEEGLCVSLIETNKQILHSFKTEYDEHVFRLVMFQSIPASQCHNYNLFNNISGQIFRIVRKMVAVKSVPDSCVLKAHKGSATAAMILRILFFKRL